MHLYCRTSHLNGSNYEMWHRKNHVQPYLWKTIVNTFTTCDAYLIVQCEWISVRIGRQYSTYTVSFNMVFHIVWMQYVSTYVHFKWYIFLVKKCDGLVRLDLVICLITLYFKTIIDWLFFFGPKKIENMPSINCKF